MESQKGFLFSSALVCRMRDRFAPLALSHRYYPRVIGMVLISLTVAFLPACANVDYLPPRQGTSAELQSELAKSLEDNMKDIGFDPAGKTVDIRVQAIGGYQNSLGLERYVKSLFQEWTVGKGGKVGPGEFRMDVFLPVLGTSATRRELSYQYIPLYYSERFRTTNQLMVMVRDPEGKVVGVWQGGREADWADIFLMRIMGPYRVPH